MTDFDLQDFTPYRTNLLAIDLSGLFTEVFLAPFKLSIPEWRVLAGLSQRQDLSVRDFSTVALDKATITRAILTLEKAGLVRRCPHPTDRRLLSLRLTGKGTALVHKLITRAIVFEAALREALGPDDVAAFKRIQAALHAFAKRTREEGKSKV